MRSLAVTLGAILMVGTPPATAAELSAGSGPCPPKRGQRVEVLQRTAQAVVFSRGGRTVACWRASGKVWALGRGAPVSALAGDRLAYAAGASVRVATLSSGTYDEVGTALGSGGGRVTDVVLRADGAVAWIGESAGGAGAAREVRQVGGLLGTGTGIEPGTLKLRGDRVAWGQSGIERSAPLTLPEPAEPGDPPAER
ncbi:MAG TPA: hypothetical protein VIL49_11970 [Capillimicrobium sp.]